MAVNCESWIQNGHLCGLLVPEQEKPRQYRGILFYDTRTKSEIIIMSNNYNVFIW